MSQLYNYINAYIQIEYLKFHPCLGFIVSHHGEYVYDLYAGVYYEV